jgi:hypothetical protein
MLPIDHLLLLSGQCAPTLRLLPTIGLAINASHPLARRFNVARHGQPHFPRYRLDHGRRRVAPAR